MAMSQEIFLRQILYKNRSVTHITELRRRGAGIGTLHQFRDTSIQPGWFSAKSAISVRTVSMGVSGLQPQ
jgi:hypothetical protein